MPHPVLRSTGSVVVFSVAALLAAVIWLRWSPQGRVALASPPTGSDDEVADDEAAGNDARRRRDETLSEMLAKTETLKIYAGTDEAAEALPKLAEPLFRYSDQPRRILDASLWGWGRKGRPKVMVKIEGYDREQGTQWLFCIVSLSPGLVTVVDSSDDHVWKSTSPGMTAMPLAEGPEPAAGKAGRQRQMKELARRFTATIVVDPNEKEKNIQEMRFLPQPIHRYDDHGDGGGDGTSGALFGFTTNGTNPDALLAIELTQSVDSAPAWRYALAGMTQGGLSVKLDDQEVWTKEYQPGPTEYTNWMWHFEGQPRPTRD